MDDKRIKRISELIWDVTENKKYGFPKKSNKYLDKFLKSVVDDYGSEKVFSLIKSDTLPIFIIKMLLGNMSSSMVLDLIVKHYGFSEVENDLEWLKELELQKNNME